MKKINKTNFQIKNSFIQKKMIPERVNLLLKFI